MWNKTFFPCYIFIQHCLLLDTSWLPSTPHCHLRTSLLRLQCPPLESERYCYMLMCYQGSIQKSILLIVFLQYVICIYYCHIFIFSWRSFCPQTSLRLASPFLTWSSSSTQGKQKRIGEPAQNISDIVSIYNMMVLNVSAYLVFVVSDIMKAVRWALWWRRLWVKPALCRGRGEQDVFEGASVSAFIPNSGTTPLRCFTGCGP